MKQFYTRAKANAGKKMNLTMPDGSASEHWVRVYGMDSDVFRAAQADQNRKTLELSDQKDSGEISEDEAEKQFEKSRILLLASAIIEWSFDSTCEEDAKIEFLTEAPQIANAINMFIGSRKAFFGKGSKASTTSQPNKKSSNKSSKDPNQQSEVISNP